MSNIPLLAAMLAGRGLLSGPESQARDRNAAQWRGWIEREQRPQTFGAVPRFIVVAPLTCLADLQASAGLMQLLGFPDLRAELVLTLPTVEALAIARAEARRDAWLGLVTLVTQDDWTAMRAELRQDLPIVRVRKPSMLTESEIATVRAWLQARGEGGAMELGPISLRRGEAPKESGGLRAPSVPDAFEPVKATVDLPPLSHADEAVVAVDVGAGAEQAIARLWGGLHSGRRRVRLAPPAILLATRPRRISIEVLGEDGCRAQSDYSFHVAPDQLQPWMLSAFLNRGGAGNPVVQAFAEGAGCRLAYAEDEPDVLRDIPVVWGVLRQSDRILDQAKRQSLYFYYIDHAYFDRGHGHNYRIARNAYEAGAVRACPPDRVDALGLDIRPWRKGGREIIVCPPTEYFMKAHDCADWLETTLARLKASSDRPVVVRTKPRPGEAATPLPQALETAHALVTHSSNVAIETVCLGTPVFVSPASAAAPVGQTDIERIETPAYPDRAAWLAHLAYNQYSFDEIGDGRAWRMLRELECRDLV